MARKQKVSTSSTAGTFEQVGYTDFDGTPRLWQQTWCRILFVLVLLTVVTGVVLLLYFLVFRGSSGATEPPTEAENLFLILNDNGPVEVVESKIFVTFSLGLNSSQVLPATMAKVTWEFSDQTSSFTMVALGATSVEIEHAFDYFQDENRLTPLQLAVIATVWFNSNETIVVSSRNVSYFVILESAFSLNASTVVSCESDGTAVQITPPQLAAQFQFGQTVFGSSCNGFAVKISTVDQTTGWLRGQHATLEDLFFEMVCSECTLDETAVNSRRSLSDLTLTIEHNYEVYFLSLDNSVSLTLDYLSCDINVGKGMTLTTAVMPGRRLLNDIPDLILHFELYLTVRSTWIFSVATALTATLSKTIPFGEGYILGVFGFMIGPVPVFGEFKVSLDAPISLSISVKQPWQSTFSTADTFGFEVETGYSKANGLHFQFDPISKHVQQLTAAGSSPECQLTASIGLYFAVHAILYYEDFCDMSVGPKLTLSMTFTFPDQSGRCPCTVFKTQGMLLRRKDIRVEASIKIAVYSVKVQSPTLPFSQEWGPDCTEISVCGTCNCLDSARPIDCGPYSSCCPTDSPICCTNNNNLCCSSANPQCCPTGIDRCCPQGSTCCQFGCCPQALPQCCANGNRCCAQGAICCADTCCPSSTPVCCGTKCCSSGSTCCGNFCCASGTTCCGTGCCKQGYTCENNQCVKRCNKCDHSTCCNCPSHTGPCSGACVLYCGGDSQLCCYPFDKRSVEWTNSTSFSEPLSFEGLSASLFD